MVWVLSSDSLRLSGCLCLTLFSIGMDVQPDKSVYGKRLVEPPAGLEGLAKTCTANNRRAAHSNGRTEVMGDYSAHKVTRIK